MKASTAEETALKMKSNDKRTGALKTATPTASGAEVRDPTKAKNKGNPTKKPKSQNQKLRKHQFF